MDIDIKIQTRYRCTVDSNKLEHGCRMSCEGYPSFVVVGHLSKPRTFHSSVVGERSRGVWDPCKRATRLYKRNSCLSCLEPECLLSHRIKVANIEGFWSQKPLRVWLFSKQEPQRLGTWTLC